MRKGVIGLVSVLLMTSPFANAEEVGPIVEGFACKFQAGRGFDDLRAGVQYWNQQMDALGVDNYFSGIAVPIRANVEEDFYWIGVTPDLNAMGTGLQNYLTSTEGQAANARLQQIAQCRPNLFIADQLMDALPEEPDDRRAALQFHACTLHEGKSLDDAQRAEKNWVSVAESQGAQVDVSRWTPWMANTPADVVYVVINDDLTTLAARETTWLTSSESQAVDEQFEKIMNCESGIFGGQQIRVPTPPAE